MLMNREKLITFLTFLVFLGVTKSLRHTQIGLRCLFHMEVLPPEIEYSEFEFNPKIPAGNGRVKPVLYIVEPVLERIR